MRAAALRERSQRLRRRTESRKPIVQLDRAARVLECRGIDCLRALNPTARGAPFSPGAIVDAQLWYRDPQSNTGPAGGKGTALLNAIEFTGGL